MISWRFADAARILAFSERQMGLLYCPNRSTRLIFALKGAFQLRKNPHTLNEPNAIVFHRLRWDTQM
jgi:hypothetical protein